MENGEWRGGKGGARDERREVRGERKRYLRQYFEFIGNGRGP